MPYKGEPGLCFKTSLFHTVTDKDKNVGTTCIHGYICMFSPVLLCQKCSNCQVNKCRKIRSHSESPISDPLHCVLIAEGTQQPGALFAESRLWQYLGNNKELARGKVSATAMNFPALISFHQYFSGNENV
jgi:hypothetical protein